MIKLKKLLGSVIVNKLPLKIKIILSIISLSFIIRMYTYFIIGIHSIYYDKLLTLSFILLGVSLVLSIKYKTILKEHLSKKNLK